MVQGDVSLNQVHTTPSRKLTFLSFKLTFLSTKLSTGEQLRDENKLATERTAENLVFREDVLTVGGLYTFRLTATFDVEGVEGMQLETYAELKVIINSPPCAGAFLVHPRSAKELEEPKISLVRCQQ